MAARVAVVDDEPAFLELMGTLLEDDGYESFLLMENDGVVEALVSYAPDIIILDLLFGSEEVGWEILGNIRSHPILASIPVVLCTAAKRLVADRIDELRAQQTWFLEKPFDIDDIATLIRSLIASPEALSQD